MKGKDKSRKYGDCKSLFRTHVGCCWTLPTLPKTISTKNFWRTDGGWLVADRKWNESHFWPTTTFLWLFTLFMLSHHAKENMIFCTEELKRANIRISGSRREILQTLKKSRPMILNNIQPSSFTQKVFFHSKLYSWKGHQRGTICEKSWNFYSTSQLIYRVMIPHLFLQNVCWHCTARKFVAS